MAHLQFSLKEVILLDILEVVYGTYLELYGSGVVTYDDAVGVELEYADGPHLCDAALYGMPQGLCLVVAVDEDEDFLGVHHGAYTYGYRCLGHFVDVVVKEA